MTQRKLQVADALRQWRKRKGWSRKKAAQFLGITERTLENWEYGHRAPPSLHALDKLWASRRSKS